jgi:hypothetical protein
MSAKVQGDPPYASMFVIPTLESAKESDYHGAFCGSHRRRRGGQRRAE